MNGGSDKQVTGTPVSGGRVDTEDYGELHEAGGSDAETEAIRHAPRPQRRASASRIRLK
jgi:hypothetical protein